MSGLSTDEYIKEMQRLNPEILGESKTPEQETQGRLKSFIAEIEKPLTALDRLRTLSTTLRLDEMEENLENDRYVFDQIALAGQLSLFYALPNTGKTLLFIYFLIEAINDESIKSKDVFYINADDSYKGLFVKTQIAKQYGFQMISPNESNVTSSDIIQLFIEIAESGEANGKIIILDTVKKFVNLMSKQDQSSFYNSLRMLTAKNATVIMAGHANKYPDAEGNLIYEGTSDTINDVDCVYSINRMSPINSNEMIVEFRNEKNRGDVLKKVSYRYDNSEGKDWFTRLKSIAKLGSSEAQSALNEKSKQDKINRYESEVLFITEILKEGQMNQSEINKKYNSCCKNDKSNLHALACEFSGRELLAALKSLVGISWTITRDIKHNAIKYELIDISGANYLRVKDDR